MAASRRRQLEERHDLYRPVLDNPPPSDTTPLIIALLCHHSASASHRHRIASPRHRIVSPSTKREQAFSALAQSRKSGEAAQHKLQDRRYLYLASAAKGDGSHENEARHFVSVADSSCASSAAPSIRCDTVQCKPPAPSGPDDRRTSVCLPDASIYFVHQTKMKKSMTPQLSRAVLL